MIKTAANRFFANAEETPLVDAEEEDDPLAIIIRKACSRELTDLGLVFNSLNIKVVQSEVAEARRRQSAAEAQANADIVSVIQTALAAQLVTRGGLLDRAATDGGDAGGPAERGGPAQAVPVPATKNPAWRR